MARYPEYSDLPHHVREMLRAVTDGTDATAERYAHVAHKHLKGRSVMFLMNAWFGQRVVERFLLDMGNYLGVEDMDRFEASFGKRR
ncbi:MAG: hypothetical protein ACYTG3_12705 [Planctomycetota bacterium]